MTIVNAIFSGNNVQFIDNYVGKCWLVYEIRLKTTSHTNVCQFKKKKETAQLNQSFQMQTTSKEN